MKNKKIAIQPLQEKHPCTHSKSALDEIAGEQYCLDCGKVLVENIVDLASELHTSDYQNLRTGPKTTLNFHDRGLSTDIGKSDIDSAGKPISFEMKSSFKRMRRWDSRSKANTTSSRNLRVALLEMSKLNEKLALSDSILEKASYFYRKASEKSLIRGRSIKSIVGACVYASCRELGTTRTIIEISKNLQENRHNIARSYRILFQRLNLGVPIADLTKSIIKFSNNLGVSEKTKREAIAIYDNLKDHKVTAGKKPDAVAATVIYMACIKNKEDISQTKISKISGITGVTIRNRVNEFKKFVNLL